ncbi:class I SAM-dependent methyltransferase [Sporomusa termitida]|uniref:Trans-aconitate 2-methyltransferase n=1 Tax=Sporomusa termitida TaxID=2377 RepID=A0A517DQ54_9FIRM|nr:class I SAM-dependent methyltransferase [Sporomusa termitida]QDR79491.1 Trans-aconitate 2-methyltransferase [Sporomusa termitida]
MEIHNDSVSLAAYESMAEYYLNDVDNKSYNAYYERPATLSLLPDIAGQRVVDAGCAAGWYTQWLLARDAAVTALDFSPRMIEMTRKRVGDRAEIIQADLNRPLDFIGDQSQDIIISSLTLHYLKDWTVVMNEFHRILVKEGMLIFSVHHPFMDFAVFKKENYFLTELLADEWETPTGRVKVNFYRRPLSAIISSVLGAGFIIDQLQEPMPTEKFKEEQPNEYERLRKKPHFLFLRARKP